MIEQPIIASTSTPERPDFRLLAIVLMSEVVFAAERAVVGSALVAVILIAAGGIRSSCPPSLFINFLRSYELTDVTYRY